jgi:DnaJ-class molecular chaperone
MSEKTVKQGEVTEITCSFCRGTGVDPFGIMSWISTCCVCGGEGTITIRTPCTRCAHCQGTGAVKTFTCTSCMGKGFVPLPPGPTKVCPECHGSGDDGSAPSMACMKCRGRGFVSLNTGKSAP